MSGTFLGCPSCGAVAAVSPSDQEFVCPACRERWLFTVCRGCRDPFLVSAGLLGKLCPWCGKAGKRSSGTTADVAAAGLGRHGIVAPADADRRAVHGTVLGGYGLPLRPGSLGSIDFRSDGITIRAEAIDPVLVPYAETVDLHFGGPGTVTTGGGFIGGGVGIEGAMEGMAIAGVLNAVTTKTTTLTIVKLTTSTLEVILSTSAMAPERMGIVFAPAFGRVRAARPKT